MKVKENIILIFRFHRQAICLLTQLYPEKNIFPIHIPIVFIQATINRNYMEWTSQKIIMPGLGAMHCL